VLLPTLDPYRTAEFPVLAAARRAEALGFDSAWVGDHLVFRPPMLESMSALSAAAAVTETITLGTSVLQVPLRQPVVLAKQVATLATLAPGRVSLGVGIGGENPEEYTAVGADRSRRGKLLDEALTVLPDLLGGRAVEHHGAVLDVSAPPLEPPCTPPVPMLVGGRSEAATARATRFGTGWMPMWLSPEKVAAGRAALAAGADGVRPAPPVTMLLLASVDDDEKRAAERAAALLWRQYWLPWHVVERWTAYGSPERVAEFLTSYLDVGVDGFVLMPASDDPLAEYDRFAEVRRLVSGARPRAGMLRAAGRGAS
jgi:alkanesulfonate monooxygenase SsuD/methylene tetrahydromethanopterin reductase-like flavin-dependent oxidoreductase (luciferase family)